MKVTLKIITSWDDGCKLDLRVADLLGKHGLDGVFFIPAHWRKMSFHGYEQLSLDDMLHLSDKYEIGSHTITHSLLTRISEENAAKEIFASRQMLRTLTGQEITGFCYPRGYANDHIRKMVKDAGYTWARSVEVGLIQDSEDPFWTGTTVHVLDKRKEQENIGWLEYARYKLDLASTTKDSTFHLFGHSWEIDRDSQWQALDTFLGELAQCKSI